MARCPDCNKFTQSKSAEPEIESEEFDPDSGAISISVKIVRECEDCGAELKSGTIELEGQVPQEILDKCKIAELEMQLSDPEAVEDMLTKIAKKGRFKGQKVPVAFLFGASVDVLIVASVLNGEVEEKETIYETTLKDTMRSQDMNDEV